MVNLGLDGANELIEEMTMGNDLDFEFGLGLLKNGDQPNIPIEEVNSVLGSDVLEGPPPGFEGYLPEGKGLAWGPVDLSQEDEGPPPGFEIPIYKETQGNKMETKKRK